MVDPASILERLNPPQREAVTYGEGPLLILAGAGSGKTRVITHRIAYLVGPMKIDPRRVVAMTFTNKAAGEMRERAERLSGQELAGAYLGTFHAFGLRILRAHSLEAGYPSGFVVYDTTDQQAAVRNALKELGVDDQNTSPRQVLAWISRQKNALRDPALVWESVFKPDQMLYPRCYELYEERLRRAAAVDFDDLLLQVIRLFRRQPELAARYAGRIEWLLVDEYQDTNPMQYALIRELTTRHQNICCVGDEDQSIYRFRGADIRNILDFTRDFPAAHVVKLEQNYRSTTTILAAADAVIARNTERYRKKLWTENLPGEKIRLHHAADDRGEADFVVEEMLRLARTGGVPLDNMAVLYRVNATSRLFEDRLTSRGIPYRVIGSLRFYERKEIKDLLAWVRLVVHSDSDEDFLRAAQTPPRGLGPATLQELTQRARAGNRSLHAATRAVLADPQGFSGRAMGALENFLGTLTDLANLVKDMTTRNTLTSVVEAIGFKEYLERHHPEDSRNRLENIDSLVAAAAEHDDAGAPGGLGGFLDRVCLRSDTDEVQGARGPQLMTVHSAKGLEFDVVFVVGLNRGLFPHTRSQNETGGLEEERRLMYVAMTRARHRLFLTCATSRFMNGNSTATTPSEFLEDIPRKLLIASQAMGEREQTLSTSRTKSPWPRPSDPAPTPPAGIRGPASPRRIERDQDAEGSGQAQFHVGMRVLHPDFGPGTIVQTSGKGRNLILNISFDVAGRRRILPAYVSLMPA